MLKRKNKIIIVFIVFFTMLLSASCTSKNEYGLKVFSEESHVKFVIIKITGYPNDEVYLDLHIAYDEACSVYDVTKFACKYENIPLVSSNLGGAYVKAINGLAERANGGMSGWLYCVNDSFENCNVGSDKYIIKPGDVIEWRYTLNSGPDVGAPGYK